MRIEIDTERQVLRYAAGTDAEATYPLYEADALRVLTRLFVKASWNCKYSYDWEWLGRRIIQMPDDIVRLQELIWTVKPDAIVETGVAHGGSLVFFASLLELLGRGHAIGIDIEIRPHNRAALDAHPLRHRYTLIEHSSTDAEALKEVRRRIAGAARVLVFLDSNHTKAHVAAELDAYAPLVTPGSYLVVADGVMRVLANVPRGAPEWAHDNPLAAVDEFLARHSEFERDERFTRSGVTHLPGGYLRRREDA